MISDEMSSTFFIKTSFALATPLMNLKTLAHPISESRHKQMHHTLVRVILVIPAIPRAFLYQLSATQQKTPTQTRLTSLPVAIANPAKDLFPIPWSHFNAYFDSEEAEGHKNRKKKSRHEPSVGLEHVFAAFGRSTKKEDQERKKTKERLPRMKEHERPTNIWWI